MMDRQYEYQPRTQGDVEWVSQIITRLQQHYLNRTTGPAQEQPLTLHLLYQLYRHVNAEGYGE